LSVEYLCEKIPAQNVACPGQHSMGCDGMLSSPTSLSFFLSLPFTSLYIYRFGHQQTIETEEGRRVWKGKGVKKIYIKMPIEAIELYHIEEDGETIQQQEQH